MFQPSSGGHGLDPVAAEGPGASSTGRSTLETRAEIRNSVALPLSIKILSCSCSKTLNMSSLIPPGGEMTPYLRSDI